MSFEKISDEQIQLQHQKCAKQLRIAQKKASEMLEYDHTLTISKVIDAYQLEVMQPIIFEECYALADS